MAIQTAGDLRAALVADKAAWTIDPKLPDTAPITRPSLGLLEKLPPADPAVRFDVLSLVRATPPTNVLLKNDMISRGIFGTAPSGGAPPAAVVDWRSRYGWPWITAIRDQDPCEHCWIYATTALVESMVRIEHCVWCVRSEGDYIEANKVPCGQCGNAGAVLDWIAANGLADPDCVPWVDSDPGNRTGPYWNPPPSDCNTGSMLPPPAYAPAFNRSGRTVRVPKYVTLDNVQDQKNWLENVGTLVASLDIYSDFQYWTGPKPYTVTSGASKLGSHVLLIVGFNDQLGCWIAKNSWGPYLGEAGYWLIGYGQSGIDAGKKIGLTGTNPDPWTKRRSHSGSMIESGNGALHRNFELVAPSAGNALTHYARDNSAASLPWSKVDTFGNNVADSPAFTGTTYDRNFEMVYRTTSGRLHHRWFDQSTHAWNDGPVFGPTNANGCVGFIESSYGPGNFEVVVGVGGQQLEHWYRVGANWQKSVTFGNNVLSAGGSLIQSTWGNLELIALLHTGQMQHFWRNGPTWEADQMFGANIGTPPIMLQGQYGMADEHGNGNFELVVANNAGAIEHWWRDNKTFAWAKSATFGSGIARVTSLVESSFGFDLEVVAIATSGELQHFWRDGAGWHTGVTIGTTH